MKFHYFFINKQTKPASKNISFFFFCWNWTNIERGSNEKWSAYFYIFRPIKFSKENCFYDSTLFITFCENIFNPTSQLSFVCNLTAAGSTWKKNLLIANSTTKVNRLNNSIFMILWCCIFLELKWFFSSSSLLTSFFFAVKAKSWELKDFWVKVKLNYRVSDINSFSFSSSLK